MQGTMLWFNEVKDLGVILSADGKQLHVGGGDFADGKRPEGRCAKASVSFEVSDTDDRTAVLVALIPDAPRQRARLRHSGTRARS